MKTISFASGSIQNTPLLEKVLKSAIKKVDVRKLLDYENPLGMEILRERIAALHGTHINKNNVMVTSSSQQALSIIVASLAKKSSRVFIQEPAYFGILRLIKSYAIPFDNFDSLVKTDARLENGIIYLTSNYHNPTGVSISIETKQKMAEMARKFNMIIIEDNPYDFIYFEKEKPNTIFELAPNNTFYIGGFSKMLAPGLRVGYIIASEDNLKILKQEKINQDIFTSTLGQQVCAEALKHTEYMEKLRSHFKNKRDTALNLLNYYFEGEKDVIWSKPQGGIFILLKIAETISVKKIVEIAKEKFNLILEEDKYYYADQTSRNTIRLNFVQNNDKLMQTGIARLSQAIREVKNEKHW